jgi:hypothetical protein
MSQLTPIGGARVELVQPKIASNSATVAPALTARVAATLRKPVRRAINASRTTRLANISARQLLDRLRALRDLPINW